MTRTLALSQKCIKIDARRLSKDRWIAFFYRCIAQVITGYFCKSLMSVEDIEATQQEDLTFVVQYLFLIQRTR
jgi:hypothetical protein